MHLSIIGSGYVGTTIAACFAEVGHQVTNIDIDEQRVETLNAGKSPIHEPGLADLVAKHAGSTLRATTEYTAVTETDVTFLSLPTPSNADGSLNTEILERATRSLGRALAEKDEDHVVTVKSTVLPGTVETVLSPILESTSGKTLGDGIDVGMNPEFLREGSAVEDFLAPDKIVIGTATAACEHQLRSLYDPVLEQVDAPLFATTIKAAEMIKYANNAFLATKVSLINELGNICKEYGVDAYEVADAIGLDDRISDRFLRSGLGWGGSCFPKDVAALIAAARARDYEPELLEAAVTTNDKQPQRLLSLLDEHVDVANERIAVLGLAFKPGTDDIRNSRAIEVIEGLRQRDAEVVVYDPVATDNMRERFPNIVYAESAQAALEDASGAVLLTAWDEFSALDEELEVMSKPVIVDGRRILEPAAGITYEGLTW